MTKPEYLPDRLNDSAEYLEGPEPGYDEPVEKEPDVEPTEKTE